MIVFDELRVFTHKDRDLLGNPAAVAIVESFPSGEVMGSLAQKNALPMTTFVRPVENDLYIYDVRHFSPDGQECHICGHSTMAAVEMLSQRYPGIKNGQQITLRLNPVFEINADNALVAYMQGRDIFLQLPAVADMQPIAGDDFYDRISAALNVPRPALMVPAFFAPQVRDIVVGINDPEILMNLSPDFEALKKMALAGDYMHAGLMVTSDSSSPDADILTRVFLPGIGVDEDIACGSANCSVIPFWHALLGRREFRVFYPYPPAGKGRGGGVQRVVLDLEKAQITLSGEVSGFI